VSFRASARFWARLLPALAVVTLFALVAASPSPSPAPQMPLPVGAPCSDYSQASPGASTSLFSQGDGVTQPLGAGATMAACSLHVKGTGWCYVSVFVREWDPLALAPEPGTIAMRSAYLDPSRMNFYTSNSVPWVTFSPPVVTQSLAGVAEPPQPTVSMEVRSDTYAYSYPLAAYYEPSGDPALGAVQSVSAGGSHEPITGPHPVLGHAVCEGSADVQSLRIVQCVKRADTPLTSHPFELAQRFRVPEPTELRWVELAVNKPATGPQAIGEGEMPVAPSATVAIAEAQDPGDPPADMPTSLVEALFEPPYAFSTLPQRWGSNYSFDRAVMLFPGHDYWLYVRQASGYEFLARTLTGSEPIAFTTGIGALHTRGITPDPWTLAPDRVLSFKIVGRPTAALGASPPHGEANPFRLSVAPNPASGPLRVEWSGAVGPVRLEVFDARGRRVGRGEGGAAGAWSMAAMGREGRPLPAGVYYVHARDSQGQRMVERAVIVR
jgi:hypothetical protein